MPSSVHKLTSASICTFVLPAVFGLLLTVLATSSDAEEWSRFRGPDGTGIAAIPGLPTAWKAEDYEFNVEIPGIGHSSPVVHGRHLILTSAVDEGFVRFLWNLDALTGEVRWSRRIGMSRSHKHSKSSWASGTPVTDGEAIFVAFADREQLTLASYSMDGDLNWRRVLGEFDSQHGHGVSPILFEDMIILPNDQKGPSTVMAFNKSNGETRWSTLREFRKTSYATPRILSINGGSPQLICVSGAMGVSSLDPFTGKLNWMTGEMPMRTVASPAYESGLIIATCGGGGVGKLLIAVRPEGSDGTDSGTVVYERDKTLPYVPSPVGYEGHVYLWGDNGVVSCIEAASGENIWTKRVGGNYSGSPVCINGNLYAISEEGEVVVVAASPEYELKGRTQLGDNSHATPSVGHNGLYLRSFGRIMRLGAKASR